MVRSAALKTTISVVLSAPLEKQENIVTINVNNEDVNRVNLIATVIDFSAEEKRLTIDDGSGQILVQWFDVEYDFIVGQTVLLIGRIRQFSQRYLFPEVIKRIDDNLWVTIRKKELVNLTPITTEQPLLTAPDDSALTVIHELDTGDGADFDSVVEKLGDRGEEIVKRLLMAGEIFESKPGRLRLL